METKGKADQLADWRLFLIILVCRRKSESLEVDRAASITLLCCCDVFNKDSLYGFWKSKSYRQCDVCDAHLVLRPRRKAFTFMQNGRGECDPHEVKSKRD